tara:strand:- start:217 stop:1212 length:996 start_codon:yes stop_codon:yes gene_type:complete
MKNILITGAEGFIGSHLTELLVRHGYNVKSFVFYNSFNSYGWLENSEKKIIDSLEIITGDIRDYGLIEEVSKNVDCIINLAALIGIPYSYKSPESYLQTNTIGAMNIFQAAKKNNVEKIIHTSTSEVYGTPKKTPIKENFLINAQSPYAASKIAADQVALSFYKSFNLPITILRPFNTYGPRQSARAIIPTVITQNLKSKNLKLGNLNPTREFNYVEDTIQAFRLAIKNKECVGEIINIGNGFDISIKKLVLMTNKLMNKKNKIIIEKKRKRVDASEVMKLKSCNKKAIKILKWKPKYSGVKGLENGLKKTIEWFSNEENLKFYKFNKYNI